MGIIVNSPFNGKPVKVRDQDAGRAVKDDEGRLFYVLPRSDGNGHYGSITRAPNTKDEARAMELEGKVAVSKGEAQKEYEVARAEGTRRGARGKLVILVLFIIVLVLVYLFTLGPFKIGNYGGTTAPPPAPVGTPSGSLAPEASERLALQAWAPRRAA